VEAGTAAGEEAARIEVITVPENEGHVAQDMIFILLETFSQAIQ
jgi:hypothetical protein